MAVCSTRILFRPKIKTWAYRYSAKCKVQNVTSPFFCQIKNMSSDSTSETSMMRLTYEGDVGIINFGEGEKRLSNGFMGKYHQLLDEVERNTSCKALISTGEGKFFSNGLDVEWLIKQSEASRRQYMVDVRQLLQRILVFPMPTVAALNGHTFAAGAFIALAHDYRVMTTGRGWISWNEIFIKKRFTHFLMELSRNKLTSHQTINQALVFGKRFTAAEAKEFNIVEVITEPAQVLPAAVQLAKSIVSKVDYDREFMKTMKEDVYYSVIKAQSHFIDHPKL